MLGQRANVSEATELAIRCLNNTTEQMLLGLILRMAFAVSSSGSGLSFTLSAVNAVWLSGRVLFVTGYNQPGNPMGRELGFDLTLFSSAFLIIPIVLRLYFS